MTTTGAGPSTGADQAQQPVRSRARAAVTYALVLLLAVELAVWESFLVPLRGFGVPLPLAPVLAVVGNVALGIAGARVLGSRTGAILPGLVWVVLALTLGSRTAEGDVVVQGSGMGEAFLVAGTVAATAVAALARGRATPGAVPGR